MRKAVTLIMIGTMILISIVMPAISESSIRYSEDAVKQCCDIWNDYYAQYHLFLDCGYNLSKSDKSVDQLWICYNRDHVAVPSLTDVIPSNASLLTICSVNEQIYGFHIVSESMKSDLEKVIIYTDLLDHNYIALF